MKTSRVVLGILAGAAAGALIGVLFAPDKGENTRKKIRKQGEDFVDGMKERADQIKGQVKGQMVKAVDRVADAIHSHEPEDLSGNNSRQRHARVTS